jgi:hypothetical protein
VFEARRTVVAAAILLLAGASSAFAEADWTIWRAVRFASDPPRWSPVKPIPFEKCREAIADEMAADYAGMKMDPKHYSDVQINDLGRITAQSTTPAPRMNPNAPPVYGTFVIWMECWPAGTQPH